MESTGKREEIIIAAYKLFVRRGREKTSIRNIAMITGINVNSIYYYFTTKAEIVICCVEYGLKQVSHRMFSLAIEGDISQDKFVAEFLKKNL